MYIEEAFWIQSVLKKYFNDELSPLINNTVIDSGLRIWDWNGVKL